MAKYTFTVESDDLHEVADFINRANDAPRNQPEETPAEEPAPAKQTRQRKPKAEEGNAPASAPTEPPPSVSQTEADAPSTEQPSAGGEPEEHPLLKEYTLADIKAKATELITAGGGETTVAIMDALKSRFGAEGFGQLKPEDYSRCMAMLDEVGS